MHALVLAVICATTLLEFAVKDGAAPGILKFVPEALSAVIAAFVLLEGARDGFARVSLKYWAAFGFAAFVIVSGALTNSVGSGPIVAGARFYLRAIPLFFVPAVFPFSDAQLRRQLKLVLAIGLLQLPVAAIQRYLLWTTGHFSGDDVRGTVLDSGVLSILLICIALVLLGLNIRRHIRRLPFIALFLLVLIPTTINETKATVVLLPLGLLATIAAGSPPGRRLRTLALGCALIAVFGAIMVPVYDFFQSNNPYKNERHLVDFFTSEKQVDAYMVNQKGVGLGSRQNVRRGDAYRVPLEYLARDPVRLAFGLGVGNASNSTLGENFAGRYYGLFQSFVITSFSVFLLEIGLLGTVAVFWLYALNLLDALAVARSDPGLQGALAVGWIGVVVVMTASTFYTVMHSFASLSYLYWYFAGLVAARRAQLALASERLHVAAARA